MTWKNERSITGPRCIVVKMKEGMDYGELCKTITINIVNFRYLSHIHEYHSTFQLYEREQKLLLTICSKFILWSYLSY